MLLIFLVCLMLIVCAYNYKLMNDYLELMLTLTDKLPELHTRVEDIIRELEDFRKREEAKSKVKKKE